MNLDNYLFAFDFDGTLVKSTKFENVQKNIENFKSFKLFINPDAFQLNWCIVTSRPKTDIKLLEECLIRNGACNYKGVYHQPFDIPVVGCDKEYQIKAEHLINLYNNYSYKGIVYIDNSERVRLMVKKAIYKATLIYPKCGKITPNIFFKDTVTMFKYFVEGINDK